jgi:hypothetical protein
MKTVATITDNKIVFAVDRQINAKMNKVLAKIASDVKPKISEITLSALNESTTVNSLLYGKLKDDFGLFGNIVNTTINNIISIISDGIEVKLNRSNKSASIVSTSLKILPYKDFSKIVSVAGGSVPSKRGDVDWLEWLLTRGTEVVIGDFWLFPYAKGRTKSGGTSIMREIQTVARPAFRVDPNFAGTEDDNFITRAIQSKSDDFLRALAEAVDRNL